MKLEELTKKRRDHVKSCQNNDDYAHRMVADLYSDKSHFIYELLQNADDALASNVSFQLSRDQLTIIHNGKRKFTFKDIESITAIGSSTKPDKINSIGRFGAGFKSVFTITKTPLIHSGKYNFQIVDYIVPESIKAIPNNDQTIIILPFNNEFFGSKDEIYKNISRSLKEFSKESLLFLNNIRKITWANDKDFGYYSCSKNYAPDVSIIQNQINYGQEELTEYLLFYGRGINSLNLTIAYLRQDSKLSPIPIEKPLFVFFPTKESLRFKFLVHVPYKTTPNRETISYEDYENQQLTTQLAQLVAESIVTLKDMGYVNVGFLSLLPIDKENSNPIYQVVFQKVQRLFSQYDLLPTTDSTFSRPQNCLLAESKKMVDLLSSENINSLFNKTNWIDTEITNTKNSTQLLWTYLRECLKIDEISPHKFVSSITSHFLAQQSDEWIINFYIFLNQTSSYSRQRAISQPIIRLEDNRHVEPYGSNNSPQVYFPKENSSRFQTVKRSILENKEAKTFLESLGIKEPDGLAEIKTFIVPRYAYFPDNIISEKNYLKDLDYVYSIWNNSNPNDQSEIIDNLLKNSYFIGCFNNQKLFTIRKRENEDNYSYYLDQAKSIVYFQSQELTEWFEGNTEDQYFFVSQEIGSKYKEFLRRFGVKSSIFLENLNPDPSQKHHSSYFKGVDRFSYRFKIHGLQYSLNHINLSRSLQIWSILLETTEKLKGKMEYKHTKKQEEEWKSWEHERLSLAMEELTKYNWLFDKEGTLIEIPLADISWINLHQDYNFEHPKFEKLVKILELKSSDEIKTKKLKEENEQLKREKEEANKRADENEKKRIEAEREAEEANKRADKLKQQLQEMMRKEEINKIEDENDSYSEFPNADDVKFLIDDTPLESIQTKDLSESQLSYKNTVFEEFDYAESYLSGHSSKAKSARNSSNSREAKKIGDKGEEYAEKYLKDKFKDDKFTVINWNVEGDGEGYDFKILENGKDIAYYEVKSKTDEKPTSFLISRTQWNFATYLYNQKQGEKYIILLISNVGEAIITPKEIPNPVQQWKEGKLEAKPVEIIL